MRVLLLMLSLWSAVAAAAPAAESRVADLSVPGMTCPVCPITVRKALTALPGVVSAEVDYDSRSATVVYDPARVDVARLRQATADAGYPSELKEARP